MGTRDLKQRAKNDLIKGGPGSGTKGRDLSRGTRNLRERAKNISQSITKNVNQMILAKGPRLQAKRTKIIIQNTNNSRKENHQPSD
jgi:hypothetical protein